MYGRLDTYTVSAFNIEQPHIQGMLLSFSPVPGKDQFYPPWILLDQIFLIYIYVHIYIYNVQFLYVDSQEIRFFKIFQLGYAATIKLNSYYMLANLTYQTKTTENTPEIPTYISVFYLLEHCLQKLCNDSYISK